jgi:hypothetical protein
MPTFHVPKDKNKTPVLLDISMYSSSRLNILKTRASHQVTRHITVAVAVMLHPPGPVQPTVADKKGHLEIIR